ncbi:hypothetical protein IV203_028310 [Nitzschia inconspicua]|uniref:Uncharacterized protein n=1 Tax=Nitzschia inconspicua TaxID=303405 RepID=A0A9K3PBA9_9STRA|nr:hypothetical protein IV203_028310 [Nitzschia inconspicua]
MSLRRLQDGRRVFVVEGFRPQTLRSRLRLQSSSTTVVEYRRLFHQIFKNHNHGMRMITAYKVIRIVATFGTIGGTKIDCLDGQERLLRWTAMYRATVLQSDVDVGHFRMIYIMLQLKLAILSHRSKNRTSDSTAWKLALATEADSQYSRRIPYGMIVDQVKIPGLAFNHNQNTHHPDYILRVSVTALRESGYYDQNIVPLVALLNVVAVSVLTFQDSDLFHRALITQHCLCGNVHPHDRGFAFAQRLDRNKAVERDFEEIEAECLLPLTTWTKQQQQEQQPRYRLTVNEAQQEQQQRRPCQNWWHDLPCCNNWVVFIVAVVVSATRNTTVWMQVLLTTCQWKHSFVSTSATAAIPGRITGSRNGSGSCRGIFRTASHQEDSGRFPHMFGHRLTRSSTRLAVTTSSSPVSVGHPKLVPLMDGCHLLRMRLFRHH